MLEIEERDTPRHLAGERCWYCSAPLPARHVATYRPPGDAYDPALYCSRTCAAEDHGLLDPDDFED